MLVRASSEPEMVRVRHLTTALSPPSDPAQHVLDRDAG